MKKLLYFAFAAGLVLTSCGSKGESANNNAEQSANTEAPERPEHGPRPEGRPEGHCPGNPNDMIQRKVDKMSEALNLNDEQKQKLVEIYTQQFAKFDSIRAAEKAEKGEQMKAMMEAEKEAIKSILTAEQQAKLDTMKMECPKGPRGPKPGPDGAPEGRPEGRPEGPHGGPRHHGPAQN